MPQNPIPVQVRPYPALKNKLNLTAATVVKVGKGTCLTVSVIVAGSAPGTINDVATDAPTADNQIGIIPNAVGSAPVNFAFSTGLLIVPGAGQTVAVSYQ